MEKQQKIKLNILLTKNLSAYKINTLPTLGGLEGRPLFDIGGKLIMDGLDKTARIYEVVDVHHLFNPDNTEDDIDLIVRHISDLGSYKFWQR